MGKSCYINITYKKPNYATNRILTMDYRNLNFREALIPIYQYFNLRSKLKVYSKA
jgi:hypothetical protein